MMARSRPEACASDLVLGRMPGAGARRQGRRASRTTPGALHALSGAARRSSRTSARRFSPLRRRSRRRRKLLAAAAPRRRARSARSLWAGSAARALVLCAVGVLSLRAVGGRGDHAQQGRAAPRLLRQARRARHARRVRRCGAAGDLLRFTYSSERDALSRAAEPRCAQARASTTRARPAWPRACAPAAKYRSTSASSSTPQPGVEHVYACSATQPFEIEPLRGSAAGARRNCRRRTDCQRRRDPPAKAAGRVRARRRCSCCSAAALAAARAGTRRALRGDRRPTTAARSGDTPLRYAESDAARVQRRAARPGRLRAGRTCVLLAQTRDADTVRSTLIASTTASATLVALPDTQVVLLRVLLGPRRRRAPAPRRQRACRCASSPSSCAARRRASAWSCSTRAAPARSRASRAAASSRRFAIARRRSLPGDGLAFLTASSASEDAQESDELRGSFFTHALVSGLLGAADRDGDGAVVLDEAYRYAYEATLRATSRTFAGTQHPTFRYDFRGQGELVLTRPDAHSSAARQRCTSRASCSSC